MTMNLLLDESLWVSFYFQRHQAIQIGSLFRVPPIRPPFPCNSRFIRCYSNSQLAKDTWWLGGTLTLILNNGSMSPDFEIKRVRIPLYRTTLIWVPDYIEEYYLKFEAAWWHSEIELSIDKFIGTIVLNEPPLQLESGINLLLT